MIGQWKGKEGLEVLERGKRGRSAEDERLKETEKDGGRRDGKEMEQNHVPPEKLQVTRDVIAGDRVV